MSRIYFRDQVDQVGVLGTERAHMGQMVGKVAATLMLSSGASILRPFVDQSHWLHGMNDYEFEVRLGLALGPAASGDPFVVDGEVIETFSLVLNTVMVAGSDTLRLLARVHGQCEVHARIDGPDRVWFANLVEEGLALRVLRSDRGWEAVAEFARARQDSPIVMHYSVSDTFPGPGSSTWTPTSTDEHGYPDYEPWYELADAEKWRMGIEWLSEHGPRLQPDDWSGYRFTHRVSGFDLIDRGLQLSRSSMAS